MDLSKAYDCLPHGLLIAKLQAKGLDEHPDTHGLNLVKDYLRSRKPKDKIGSKVTGLMLKGNLVPRAVF